MKTYSSIVAGVAVIAGKTTAIGINNNMIMSNNETIKVTRRRMNENEPLLPMKDKFPHDGHIVHASDGITVKESSNGVVTIIYPEGTTGDQMKDFEERIALPAP